MCSLIILLIYFLYSQGKPSVAHIVQVTSGSPDSNLQNIHAHLARITHSNSDYEQLPQSGQTYSYSQTSPKDTDGKAKHNRFGGYSRLTSSTSTAPSSASEEATELDILSIVDVEKRDQVGEDSIWQPKQPTTGKADYKEFTDEEDTWFRFS